MSARGNRDALRGEVLAKLTDYLELEEIRHWQDAFCEVAGAPLAVLSPEGRALIEQQTDGEAPTNRAPIHVDGELLGYVAWPASTPDSAGPEHSGVPGGPSPAKLAELLAEFLARQCRQQGELTSRVEQLVTLYRITAEFTHRRDLQGVLDLAASAVVEVMPAKACSIRLLSEDRTELLVKAVANLSPEYLAKGPILLSQSLIDQEVLASSKPVYIADERSDPRVLYPAEARREGIVSALCAPMVYKGRAEGVMRVYTGRPHKFDRFEEALLETVAGQAAAAIVNARLYEEAVRAANMKRQLRLAGEVQRRMIPSEPPRIPGLEIAAVYVPSFELSGDFFDFLALPEHNWGLAICDVVGKGVRASLLMASTRASLRAHALNVYRLSDVLEKVNRDLCTDTLTSDFATLFYGVLDAKTRQLTYANAGHVLPMLFADGKWSQLACGGPVLGVYPDGVWPHESIALRSGQVLLIYTDGLSEALNFDDEPFGKQRIRQAVEESVARGGDAEDIAKHVLWQMRRFAGLQQRLDDLTLLVVKVL